MFWLKFQSNFPASWIYETPYAWATSKGMCMTCTVKQEYDLCILAEIAQM